MSDTSDKSRNFQVRISLGSGAGRLTCRNILIIGESVTYFIRCYAVLCPDTETGQDTSWFEE
jgi:hypothetical protein